MVVDGLLRAHELACNVGVREALRQQLENLELTRRQPRRVGYRLGPRPTLDAARTHRVQPLAA